MQRPDCSLVYSSNMRIKFFQCDSRRISVLKLKKKIIEGQKYYCEMAVLLQALNNKRLYFEMCQVPLQGVLCASMCVCGLPRMISTDITTLTQVSAADSAPFRHF